MKLHPYPMLIFLLTSSRSRRKNLTHFSNAPSVKGSSEMRIRSTSVSALSARDAFTSTTTLTRSESHVQSVMPSSVENHSSLSSLIQVYRRLWTSCTRSSNCKIRKRSSKCTTHSGTPTLYRKTQA